MHEAAPNEVIICTKGHVSREADGFPAWPNHKATLRCRKLRGGEIIEGEAVGGRKCGAAANVVEQRLAKPLYAAGYRAAEERIHVLALRTKRALQMWVREVREAFDAQQA